MTDSTDHYAPTPRTDNHARVYQSAGAPAAYTVLLSHARQLERELNEARLMLDAFADCGDCGDEWIMADYRELPHVRARKTK